MENAQFTREDLQRLAELTLKPQVDEFATLCKQVKFFKKHVFCVTLLPTIYEEPDHKSNTEST